jgi:hypothetical protein
MILTDCRQRRPDRHSNKTRGPEWNFPNGRTQERDLKLFDTSPRFGIAILNYQISAK